MTLYFSSFYYVAEELYKQFIADCTAYIIMHATNKP